MKIDFSKQMWRRLQHNTLWWLRDIPSYVLVRKVRVIELLCLMAGLLIGLYIVIVLLFTEAEVMQTPLNQPSLPSEIMDELELKIEERQSAYERGLNLRERAYFLIEKVPE